MRPLLFSLLVFLWGTDVSGDILDSTTVVKFLEGIAAPAGQVISGSVLSTANTHGGIPHFSGGIGFGFLTVKTVNPVKKDTLFPDSLIALIPTFFAHASLGLFKGFNLAPTVGGTGSLDLLGRFGYFPMRGDFKEYADKTPILLGGGIKLGFLRDGLTTPALSATASYTTLRDAAFTFEADSVTAKTSFDLSTWSFHIDASKKIVIFTPYAGIGWDNHKLKAGYDILFASGSSLLGKEYEAKSTTKRFYGGVELSLLLLKFNLEGGKTGDNGYFTLGIKAGI